MSALNEAGNTLYQTNLDILQRCTALMLDTGHKLCQMQTEAVKEMISRTGRLAGSMTSERDPGRFAAESAQMFQDNVQRSVEASRAFFSAAVEVQTELTRIGGEIVPLFGRQMVEAVEQVARAAGAAAGGVTGLAAVREDEPANVTAHRPRRAA